MNSAANLGYCKTPTDVTAYQTIIPNFILQFSAKHERRILKIILLGRLHQLFHELFNNELQCDQSNDSEEYYEMDSKIIQLLIQGIIETDEYTLEGISIHTRIPFDVIYDAACGLNSQFSITPWARLVDLYMQVKPDIARLLINKLIELKEKNHRALTPSLIEE